MPMLVILVSNYLFSYLTLLIILRVDQLKN